MFLREKYIEIEEEKAKKQIAKLQRQNQTGEISDDEYDDKYNTVMDNLRLRYYEIMQKRL